MQIAWTQIVIVMCAITCFVLAYTLLKGTPGQDALVMLASALIGWAIPTPKPKKKLKPNPRIRPNSEYDIEVTEDKYE